MRAFNESEKAVIRKLASLEPEQTTLLTEFLGSLYFSEEKGRAMIIQTAGKYAVFYLRPEIFDNEKSKRIEIIKLLELISLIRYLKNQGYLFIYTGEPQKAKSMYFLNDSFKNPQQAGEAIVLNAQGDHTSKPESIFNKANQVVYKGISFDPETYEMMVNNLTGVLYVSLELRNLVRNQFDLKEKKEVKNPKWQIRTSIVVAFFFVLAGLFFEFKTYKLKSTIDELKYGQDSLRETVNDATLKIERMDSTLLETNSGETVSEAHDSICQFYHVDVSLYNGDTTKQIDQGDSLTLKF